MNVTPAFKSCRTQQVYGESKISGIVKWKRFQIFSSLKFLEKLRLKNEISLNSCILINSVKQTLTSCPRVSVCQTEFCAALITSACYTCKWQFLTVYQIYQIIRCQCTSYIEVHFQIQIHTDLIAKLHADFAAPSHLQFLANKLAQHLHKSNAGFISTSWTQ